MPDTPNRPCQRCKQVLTTSTYCPACQVIQDAKKQSYRQQHDHRPSPRKRGYDTAWEKARKMQLRRFPLCQDCHDRGRIRPATTVHHIISVEDRPDLRLDLSNMASLCRDCHEIRHNRKAGKMKFDKDGMPLFDHKNWSSFSLINELEQTYLTSVRIFYLTLSRMFYLSLDRSF